jgi:16S rRNA (uracil1498-N3)-methyltransferase
VAHLFVEDLVTPVLDHDDVHHLVRVLRTRPGDEMSLSDGRGRRVDAVLEDVDGRIEVVGEIEEVAPPPYELTVAFAPVKGDRPEWAVQKLTEIGVDRIVPLLTERSVVRWSGARADKQVARLARVAREAAMQSRRCRLPTVAAPRPLSEVVGAPGVVMAEPGGAPPTGRERTLLIGPEGGWTAGESAGSATVGLGPNVLRAETAAVVGSALLVAIREGVTTPVTNSG